MSSLPRWAESDSARVSALHLRVARAVERLVPHERARRALLRRARIVLHRGSGRVCPICGSAFRHFMSDWNRPEAICWSCGAHERHRWLWRVLTTERPELLAETSSLLHFAPEHCLRARLAARVGRYASGDLDPAKGDLELDVTALALPDGAFDAIICSHVLEHVPDDATAMRELRRVLAAGGWLIVMVPLDPARSETYEDWSITEPDARREAFWQPDHVRVYALDIVDRLRAAGFAAVETLAPAQRTEFGFSTEDVVFLCRSTETASVT